MLRGASLHFRLRAKTAVVYLLRNRSTAHSDICCFCKLMLDVRCHRQKLTWIYWFFVDFAFQKCWPFQCITLIDLFEACHIPSHTHTPMRRVREAKQLQSIHTSCPYHYDAISQGTYKACLKRDISMMICHYIYIYIYYPVVILPFYTFILSPFSYVEASVASLLFLRHRRGDGSFLVFRSLFQLARINSRWSKTDGQKWTLKICTKSYDVCYNATTWIFGDVTQKPVSGTSITLRLRSFRLWWKIVSCCFVP